MGKPYTIKEILWGRKGDEDEDSEQEKEDE
jgi:hypothetical protein